MFSVTAASRGVHGTSQDYTLPGEDQYCYWGLFLVERAYYSFSVKNLFIQNWHQIRLKLNWM